MNTTAIAVEMGCRDCLIAVFRRAMLDGTGSSQPVALDAINFLCSERATDWVQLLNLPPSAAEGLAQRCWTQAQARFGLSLADLESIPEDRP